MTSLRRIRRSSEDRHAVIEEALRGKNLTTIELEALLEEKSAHCPGDLSRTLNVMRRKA